MAELRGALVQTATKAKAWEQTRSGEMGELIAVQRQARLFDEAAEAMGRAEQLDVEVGQMALELATSAEMQLGELLSRRLIKPGAFVAQSARSNGKHAGEMSKADFRSAVNSLGMKPGSKQPGQQLEGVDAVFDMFDEDRGGFMDAQEAKTMIKSLLASADRARRAKADKARIALVWRREALRKERLVTMPSGGEAADDSAANTSEETARSASPASVPDFEAEQLREAVERIPMPARAESNRKKKKK